MLLTAEPVLEKMLSEALSSKDALSREPTAIDAPSTESQALGAALTRAFYPAADSPRVRKSAQTSDSRLSTGGATMGSFARTTKSMY